MNSGLCKRLAERVRIVSVRYTPSQRRFKGRCTATHEWVVNDLARIRKPFDEERGQLRFEAGAVADFVKPMAFSLLRGPELVNEIFDAVDCFRPGFFAKLRKCLDFRQKSLRSAYSIRFRMPKNILQLQFNCLTMVSNHVHSVSPSLFY